MSGLELEHAVDARLGSDGIKASGRIAGSGSTELDALFEALDVDVEMVETFIGVTPVNVAEGDDILAGEIDQIGAAHAADADGGDVEHIAGRSESAAENVSWNDGQCSATDGGAGQEGAARDFFLFGHVHFTCATLLRGRGIFAKTSF